MAFLVVISEGDQNIPFFEGDPNNPIFGGSIFLDFLLY
jgi:hypothetical protein